LHILHIYIDNSATSVKMVPMLKNLGDRIRKIRRDKGLTLVEVAKRTGIAQATLSRIETGTMTGTIASHEKIAEALGVGLADLYSGIDKRYEQIAHVTQKADRKVTHRGKNVQVELLTTENFRKKITPLLVTLQGNSATARERLERGVEKFLFALDGEVEINIEGGDYTLKTGESLYFDASLPHQIKNEKQKQARVLVTVSPSKV